MYLFGVGDGQKVVHKEFNDIEMDLSLLIKMYIDAHDDPLLYWPELAWSWLTTYRSSKSVKLEEIERRDKAESSAHKQFDKHRGIGYDAIADDEIVRISQGRSFADIWDQKSQTQSIELLEKIFFASKGVRS